MVDTTFPLEFQLRQRSFERYICFYNSKIVVLDDVELRILGGDSRYQSKECLRFSDEVAL